MICKKKGHGIIYNRKKLVVGMRILANEKSEYRGLFGTIKEIRTGEDKDSENTGPDIFCAYDIPESAEEIEELEARFSNLYGYKKTIDNIALDCVIMDPSELDVIEEENPDQKLKKIKIILQNGSEIYLTCDEFSVTRGITGHISGYSVSGMVGNNLMYIDPCSIAAIIQVK